jgi:hypothetical protein
MISLATSVRRSGPAHALFVTAGLLAALPSLAATYTVNSTLHGTDSDGSTTTLVEAIQAANTAGGSNVIELAAGTTYSSDDTVFIDGTSAGRTMYPAITSTITIHGNGATLDATGKNARFFYVSGSGSLVLEDINLSNGKAQGGDGALGNFAGGGGGGGFGGAIFVNGTSASLAMHRCSILNCLAKGGTSASSASQTGPGGGGGGMGGSGFAGTGNSGGGGPRTAATSGTGADGVGGNAGANAGGFGGGGGGGTGGSAGGAGGFGGGGGGGWQGLPTYGTGGQGGFGGGGGGTCTPFSTPFASGGAFGGRGGAYNSGGFVNGGGGAGLGGAIFNYQGTVTLENVTLLGNNATGGAGASGNGVAAGSGAGGGVFNYDGTVTLKHVTATGNIVGTDSNTPGVATGGVLYNYDAPGGTSPSTTIYNSILTGSTYNSASGVEVYSSGGTASASGAANSSIVSSATGLTGTVLTSSPNLGLLERKSGVILVRPMTGSPALDAGDAANSLSTDAGGTSRPAGSGVDIGAAEGAFSTSFTIASGMLLVADTQADAVFAVDPATGNRSLVSRLNYRGTGPDIGNPKAIAVDSNNNIYVVNTTPAVAIVKIDPATGNRTTVSQSASPAVGTGSTFTSPNGITIRPSDGKLLVTDSGGTDGSAGSDAVIVVDPATGNRSILTDDVTPNNTSPFNTPNAIIYHSTKGVLVVDTGTPKAVFSVAANGARTVFSSASVPDATNPLTTPAGLAEDTDGSILVVESKTGSGANRQLLRINKTTGARALVSNMATANTYSGVAAGSSGIFVIKTTAPAQILKVDATSGAVTTLSGNFNGDGILFGNATGSSIGFGIGLTFVPGSSSTTVSSLNVANSTPSKAATVNWTLTFGSAVTGVTASNFSLSGAAATGASVGTPTTSDSGLTWTVPVTSGSTDGTLTLSLANATGLSPGVSTSLPYAGQSYAMDKTAPTVSIGSPSASLTAGGPVSFTITYSDANFSSATLGAGDVTVNSTGTAAAGSVGVTGSGTTRTVTLSSLSGSGTLGISLAAGTASDTVGNTAGVAGPSATFAVDNTAPGVSIGAPSASVTAGGPVSFTVTYSDANFSGATLSAGDITVNSTGSASASSVSVTGSGTTRTVTLTGITGDGTLGISLAAGTASDTVGNLAGAAGPSTTFTVDNTAPGIVISAPSASTATTGPVTYTVTYSGENSITLGGGDLTLNKTGTADAGSVMVSGTGSTRTVTLSSLTGVGTLGISVAAGTASDTAGNLAGAAGPGTTFTVDNSPVVTTLTATNLTLTGAVLTGTVNPNGLSTVAVFESGADTNYGTVSALTLTPDNGTVDQAVNATLTGLTPGTTYHYRVAATNSAGAALGVDLTFTTAPDTSAPTNIVLSPSIVLENQSVGTTVGTLTAPDPDAALGDTATFSLVAGVGDTDNSSFSIVGNQLQTGAVFDYETKNSYSIRVRVTDVGGLTFEKALTVGIGNVNEPPIYTGYGFTCPVNTSVSVLVSKITAKTSDPEGVTRTVPSVDAVSLQGGTVVLLSGPPKTISYTPPTGYTGDDSFEVRISDGVNTITGIVTVTVGSSSGNGTALVSATMVGSDMVLKFAGIPGTHYEVQRSGGLTPPVTWTVLTTVTADASGFATYTDPNPPSPSYWRTVTVP